MTIYNWYEDFESEPIHFVENPFFSVSGGRLNFDDVSVSGSEGTTWNGGDAPGGGWPQPSDFNYFENFVVSAETFWEDHSEQANPSSKGLYQSSEGIIETLQRSVFDS